MEAYSSDRKLMHQEKTFFRGAQEFITGKCGSMVDTDGKLAKMLKSMDVAKNYVHQAELSKRFDETDYIYHI